MATRIFCEARPEGALINASIERDAPAVLKLADVRAVVAVGSARGGVGKTAICVNVAAALALAGRKVAIVDADLNSPDVLGMLGLKPLRRFAAGEEVDPVSAPLGIRVAASSLLADGGPAAFSFLDFDETEPPAVVHNGARPLKIDHRAALRRLLAARFGQLDLMLIDLASGLSQLHSLTEVIQLTGVVMVTHPSESALRATYDTLDTIAHDGVTALGLVENMLGFNCDSCHAVRPLFPQGNLTEVAHSADVPVLGRLPFDPRLADCAERGALFVREHADTPLAKQFATIAANLEHEIARRAMQPLKAAQPI